MRATSEQVAAEIRTYLAKGIDFVKFASSEARSPPRFWSSRPDVQARIVAEAHAAGVTAQAHTSAVAALRVAIEEVATSFSM